MSRRAAGWRALRELKAELAAKERLTEVLCSWGCDLERMWAEDTKGRPPQVSRTEVIRRVYQLAIDGLDFPKAKAQVAKDIGLTRRRVDKIIEEARRNAGEPVHLSRDLRLTIPYTDMEN